jgi:hypothetical protein
MKQPRSYVLTTGIAAVVDSMLLYHKEQRSREPGAGPVAPGVE